MELNKLKIVLAVLCAAITGLLKPLIAGAFGISPPHIINDRLYPGAYFEQQITLSRPAGEAAVNCKIDFNLPGFENWIEVEPGEEFAIPEGERIVKIKAKVNVPKNAAPSYKKGNLRVTVAPQQETGKINIVLGAQIDVDLAVTNEKIDDFAVRQVKIPDIETGWKIIVYSRIENTGNIENAPDKVLLKVYDSGHKNLIKAAQTSKLQKIKPFQTGETLAFFKIPLEVGQYWGEAQIYKGKDVIWEEKAIFTVRESGTLPPQPKEPRFVNLNKKTVIAAAITGILFLVLIVYFIAEFAKKRSKKRRNIFSRILRKKR
jgi:hypothetical protein